MLKHMKIEFEQSEIQVMAEKVVDLLKPYRGNYVRKNKSGMLRAVDIIQT